MNTIDETSIIVSLCRITLSDLTLSAADELVKFVDRFDKISEEDDNIVEDSSDAFSDAAAEADEEGDDRVSETECCCLCSIAGK